MHKYLETDEWRIIERGFKEEDAERSEAIFSLGNGRMGQRANFEEKYSGKSLQGSYVAGVYYPDKTRVGWWKNGYPEYFAKVLNSVNWIGIDLEIEGEQLDLHHCEISDFYRELDMQKGLLTRRFNATMQSGKTLKVEAQRFLSIARDEIGAIRYSITPVNFDAEAVVTPYLDFDVQNEDSNYDEKFWDHVGGQVGSQKAVICAKTKKLDFHVAAAMRYEWEVDGAPSTLYPESLEKDKYVANRFSTPLSSGRTFVLYKYAAVLSSLNYEKKQLLQEADQRASEARRAGYELLKQEQEKAWAAKWEMSDIRIEGDPQAQQGIRFNIFQLNQTYTGEDPRLNIGPKGFTGEKYGGSTYWDTEAYCLPFYLSTADHHVARNLLVYRYKQLDKAIDNAKLLGFDKGAALYPMVTMNGEECHNEWEITFEEIHRNGAIAYAVYNYIRHTQDEGYLLEGGLEVLTGIARFWHQRFHWSKRRGMYVMHGVTGPNEYENNVNNNWYTNYIAVWCLRYAAECLERCLEIDAAKTGEIQHRISLTQDEIRHWRDQADKVFLPVDPVMNVFVQNDGFMDKQLRSADDLNPTERPINQHWSWDRILRSCFIKQADVLQGLYFFEEEFDKDTITRNFDFYEPMTVHESSLSPCVHAILAARIGRMDKAYEFYLRTSRLDLDDYNREVAEGLHITSMAGTWMSVVQGFGGMRWEGDTLHLDPSIPDQWTRYSFHLRFRNGIIELQVDQESATLKHLSGKPVQLYVFGELIELNEGQEQKVKH